MNNLQRQTDPSRWLSPTYLAVPAQEHPWALGHRALTQTVHWMRKDRGTNPDRQLPAHPTATIPDPSPHLCQHLNQTSQHPLPKAFHLTWFQVWHSTFITIFQTLPRNLRAPSANKAQQLHGLLAWQEQPRCIPSCCSAVCPPVGTTSPYSSRKTKP